MSVLRCAALAAVLFVATTVRAEDWPQWMGPKRDAVWRETGLVEKFPADGLPKVAFNRAPGIASIRLTLLTVPGPLLVTTIV